jgi:choline-phosphate cytidylyltransferase
MEGGKSPTAGNAFEHLKHLEVPGPGDRGRPESISGSMRGRSEDFAAGYSLGLIGGVRSWVSFPLFPPESNPTRRWGVM